MSSEPWDFKSTAISEENLRKFIETWRQMIRIRTESAETDLVRRIREKLEAKWPRKPPADG